MRSPRRTSTRSPRCRATTTRCTWTTTFARQQGYRGRVVHGMLLGAYLSRVVGTVLPGPGVVWLSQDVRFAQPAYIGDPIEVCVRVTHKSPALRTLVLESTITNQRGDKLVIGEGKMMMLAQKTSVPWTEMVALVTGASRGIGAATARALGERGASVVVNYHQNKRRGRWRGGGGRAGGRQGAWPCRPT